MVSSTCYPGDVELTANLTGFRQRMAAEENIILLL